MIICPNLNNKEVAQQFQELVDVVGEVAAYDIWSQNEGNPIDRAPNGAPSKLFTDLLSHFNGDRVLAIQAKAKTFSTGFKTWFGNWNNKENVPTTDASTRLTNVLNDISRSDDRYAKLANLLLESEAIPYNLKYFRIDNDRSDIDGHAGQYNERANLIEVLSNNVSASAFILSNGTSNSFFSNSFIDIETL